MAALPGDPSPLGRSLASPSCWSEPSQGWSAAESAQPTAEGRPLLGSRKHDTAKKRAASTVTSGRTVGRRRGFLVLQSLHEVVELACLYAQYEGVPLLLGGRDDVLRVAGLADVDQVVVAEGEFDPGAGARRVVRGG